MDSKNIISSNSHKKVNILFSPSAVKALRAVSINLALQKLSAFVFQC